MSIEKANGVHSNERSQVDRSKTQADQFAEHCKLDWNMCDGDKVEDVNQRGKVKILEE